MCRRYESWLNLWCNIWNYLPLTSSMKISLLLYFYCVQSSEMIVKLCLNDPRSWTLHVVFKKLFPPRCIWIVCVKERIICACNLLLREQRRIPFQAQKQVVLSASLSSLFFLTVFVTFSHFYCLLWRFILIILLLTRCFTSAGYSSDPQHLYVHNLLLMKRKRR